MVIEKGVDIGAIEKEFYLLRSKVIKAVEERTRWLDKNMKHFAKYKIGEELFEFDTGASIGRVCEYFRIHHGSYEYDNSLSVYYLTDRGNNTAANSFGIGNREEYIENLKFKLELAGD